MHLFLDTNVLLSFFHFTKGDLTELSKLAGLVKQGHVVLWLPSQVIDECARNREAKIVVALDHLKAQSLALQFPRVCEDYAEYRTLRKLQKDYETHHAALLDRVRADAARGDLEADEVIKTLFSVASPVECDDEIVSRARRRSELGNPPGKRGSLGDAVNWEALLSAVPDGQDIFFVSDDIDYRSPLDQSFKAFLLAEWTAKKGSGLRFYRQLTTFFGEHCQDITLVSEDEKEARVQALVTSTQFDVTHLAIARLREYAEFGPAQVNQMFDAAIWNRQIRWILNDPDVASFYRNMYAKYAQVIDESIRARVTDGLPITAVPLPPLQVAPKIDG